MLEQERDTVTIDVGQEQKEQSGPDELVEGASELRAEAQASAESMEVVDYKGVGTNLGHGHDRGKHDAREKLGVTDELVEQYFRFDPADHAAPHELLARREEFMAADVDIFADAPDDSEAKWRQVKSAANSAPVPDETHRELERMSR